MSNQITSEQVRELAAEVGRMAYTNTQGRPLTLRHDINQLADRLDRDAAKLAEAEGAGLLNRNAIRLQRERAEQSEARLSEVEQERDAALAAMNADTADVVLAKCVAESALHAAREELADTQKEWDHDTNWRSKLIVDLQAQVATLSAALERIAKGEGAFSRDQLTFATNVNEESKAIATAALSGAGDKNEGWQGEAICPHCGKEVTDSPKTDIPIGDEHEIECGACQHPVMVAVRCALTYRTRAAAPAGSEG